MGLNDRTKVTGVVAVSNFPPAEGLPQGAATDVSVTSVETAVGGVETAIRELAFQTWLDNEERMFQ